MPTKQTVVCAGRLANLCKVRSLSTAAVCEVKLNNNDQSDQVRPRQRQFTAVTATQSQP